MVAVSVRHLVVQVFCESGLLRDRRLGRQLLRLGAAEGRPFIRLILTVDDGELAILVRDYCTGAPEPRDAGADDENGRGLFLVEAMSDRSGWYPTGDDTPGKVVWAVARPE